MARQKSEIQSSKSIDLNSASVDELARLRMIGRERAQDLVNYRNEHGPFRTWSDVKNIPGFSDQMIEDLKRRRATCK